MHDHSKMERLNRTYHKTRVDAINRELIKLCFKSSVLEALQKTPCNILDIGCSNGSIMDRRVVEFHNVHGLDMSAEACAVATRNGYLTAGVCDLEDCIPECDGLFDVILCAEVIEHIQDTRNFIAEMRRVLKPGGSIVMTTPNVRTLQNILLMVFGNTFTENVSQYTTPHVRDWTTKLLRRAFEEGGFECALLSGTQMSGWLPFVGGFSFSPMMARMFPSWASNVIAVFRKPANDL